MSALTDIDSLVLMVRDKESKKLIEEAIAAYRGGALRSAIVATWICAIYDAISKLRELKENGDNAATSLVDDIDTAIDRDNVNKMQNIERDMFSNYFFNMQLISKYESEIFEQLQRDRHRCAHPAQDRDSIIFRPSTEAVRAYIVHTLNTLLIHAPLHGKHAIEKFQEQIFSEHFPKDYDDARIFIRERFLKYAKETFTISLVKKILSIPLSSTELEKEKIFVLAFSLRIICDECSELFEKEAKIYVKSKYSQIIGENAIASLVIVLKWIPFIWEYLPESTKSLVISFIKKSENVTIINLCIYELIGINELHDIVLEKFKEENIDVQKSVFKSFKNKLYVNVSLDILEGSSCYANTNAIIPGIVMPLVELFSDKDVERVFDIYLKNSQVCYGHAMSELFNNIFEKCCNHNFDVKRKKLIRKRDLKEIEYAEERLLEELEERLNRF